VTNAMSDTLYTVSAWADVETNMVSYERCSYFEKIEPEEKYLNFYNEIKNLKNRKPQSYKDEQKNRK